MPPESDIDLRELEIEIPSPHRIVVDTDDEREEGWEGVVTRVPVHVPVPRRIRGDTMIARVSAIRRVGEEVECRLIYVNGAAFPVNHSLKELRQWNPGLTIIDKKMLRGDAQDPLTAQQIGAALGEKRKKTRTKLKLALAFLLAAGAGAGVATYLNHQRAQKQERIGIPAPDAMTKDRGVIIAKNAIYLIKHRPNTAFPVLSGSTVQRTIRCTVEGDYLIVHLVEESSNTFTASRILRIDAQGQAEMIDQLAIERMKQSQ